MFGLFSPPTWQDILAELNVQVASLIVDGDITPAVNLYQQTYPDDKDLAGMLRIVFRFRPEKLEISRKLQEIYQASDPEHARLWQSYCDSYLVQNALAPAPAPA